MSFCCQLNNYFYPDFQNIQEMIQKLKTASNSTEMENGCQSLSRYFNHEVKVRKKQISEQMESLRKEKDSALNQVNNVFL